MNDILFTVLEIIVAISMILVMRYLLPYLKMKLQGTIDDDVFNEIIKAVKSVEQDKKFLLGPQKKEEVIVRITAWANNRGIRITQEQISHLIETAVWIMKYEDSLNA